MNNKEFGPSLFLFVFCLIFRCPPPTHFSLRGLLYGVSSHACWTVPMLHSAFISLTFVKAHTRKNNRTGQWVIKGAGVTEMMIHSGTLCTVFIMFSFVSEMSLTPVLPASLKQCLLYSSIHFLNQISQFQNELVLNGTSLRICIIWWHCWWANSGLCQLQKGEALTSWQGAKKTWKSLYSKM